MFGEAGPGFFVGSFSDIGLGFGFSSGFSIENAVGFVRMRVKEGRLSK